MRKWCVTLLCLCVGASSLPSRAAAQEPERPRLNVSGDLRLRGEWDIDRTGKPDRARPRIRFRLAVEQELTPYLHVGGRLATAPDPNDPNSPNQDLGTAFRQFRIALDRAYIRWTPPVPVRLTVHAGKFGNPFAAPVIYRELVWDSDIHPEGVAAVLEPVTTVRLVGAQYLMLLRSPGQSVGLTAGQASWSGKIGRRFSGTAAVGVYAYQRPDVEGAQSLARENQGNALVTDVSGDTLAFVSDFDIVHAFGSLRYDAWRVPIAITGEYIANSTAASSFDDDGFAVGVQVGELGRAGRWRTHYQYQELGRESVFSPFVQDDFLNGTNLRGHLAGVGVQFLSRANAYFWILWSASQEPRVGLLQKRFRLDINVQL